MDIVALKRLGVAVLAVGLAGLVLGPYLLSGPLGAEWPKVQSWLRAGALFGFLAVALGWLGASAGTLGRRCPRCGRHAASGSVFCRAHQRDLETATRQAHARHDRDGRIW